MLGMKVAQERAQEAKQYLIAHDLLDKRYHLAREKGSVIFPVVREFTGPFEFDVEFVEADLAEQERHGSLRDALAPTLSEMERERLISSYDIVGSIAIIEVEDELLPKAQLIAQALMRVNPGVKTVLRKVGGHEGERRTQRMELLAGEDTRIATVVESGVRLRVHVEEAYYSVRMSTERLRIAKMARTGERILCMFSGVGPYPIVLSKNTQASEIVGIEINPIAHELAVENVAANRCTNVHVLLGDAHEVVPRLASEGRVFDRITMPLPHTAHEFLEEAAGVSCPGTVIHYYSFRHEREFELAPSVLRAALEHAGKKLDSYALVRAGQHAPRIWRVCVDGVVG
jgi:tRNA (guanine37-N1)-methyltransferase